MDKLEQIFTAQKHLDQYIKQKKGLENKFSKEEWIQKKCLALLDETAELLNEVNYKWWKNPKELNEKDIKEELVDILHFWVSMCLDIGLSAEEVHKIYFEKNKENLNRQDGKSLKKGYS